MSASLSDGAAKAVRFMRKMMSDILTAASDMEGVSEAECAEAQAFLESERDSKRDSKRDSGSDEPMEGPVEEIEFLCCDQGWFMGTLATIPDIEKKIPVECPYTEEEWLAKLHDCSVCSRVLVGELCIVAFTNSETKEAEEHTCCPSRCTQQLVDNFLSASSSDEVRATPAEAIRVTEAQTWTDGSDDYRVHSKGCACKTGLVTVDWFSPRSILMNIFRSCRFHAPTDEFKVVSIPSTSPQYCANPACPLGASTPLFSGPDLWYSVKGKFMSLDGKVCEHTKPACSQDCMIAVGKHMAQRAAACRERLGPGFPARIYSL